MKIKIVILSLTVLIGLNIVGCTSQQNKEMKNTMSDVSHNLDKIDDYTTTTLSYDEAQNLMEKINSDLSEFKPQLTPDNQTIILNLATRENSKKIENEYIVINMIANKTNYTIEVDGNIFKNDDNKVVKNDAAVRALYDLLVGTKSIQNTSLDDCLNMLNNNKNNETEVKKTIKNFKTINFNYYAQSIKFDMQRSYERKKDIPAKEDLTYEKYKNQIENLEKDLTEYSIEFAKTNGLKFIKNKDENSNLTTFGVEGENEFSTYIKVNLFIPNQETKTVSNICEFNVPLSESDPKEKQLHKDYLVGAIRIINSNTNSDINYGDIKNVVDSDEMRLKYLPKNTNSKTIFEFSNNVEKSLINNTYIYNQKINLK